jgi:hypothetical protein
VPAVEVSDYTAGRIGAIVDDALRRSGALGVYPTPLEAVRAHAGLEVVESPGLRREVLGAVWLEERTLFVARGQSAPRRRFTEAHERHPPADGPPAAAAARQDRMGRRPSRHGPQLRRRPAPARHELAPPGQPSAGQAGGARAHPARS